MPEALQGCWHVSRLTMSFKWDSPPERCKTCSTERASFYAIPSEKDSDVGATMKLTNFAFQVSLAKSFVVVSNLGIDCIQQVMAYGTAFFQQMQNRPLSLLRVPQSGHWPFESRDIPAI